MNTIDDFVAQSDSFWITAPDATSVHIMDGYVWSVEVQKIVQLLRCRCELESAVFWSCCGTSFDGRGDCNRQISRKSVMWKTLTGLSGWYCDLVGTVIDWGCQHGSLQRWVQMVRVAVSVAQQHGTLTDRQRQTEFWYFSISNTHTHMTMSVCVFYLYFCCAEQSRRSTRSAVSYTHLTLPTIYSV